MFREESITTSREWTWNDDERATLPDRRERARAGERYREIDVALRRIAAERSGLDVEEARWLRAAEDEGAWRKLGYVHGLEYLEDVFGYRPRTAKDRLRVARQLGELPQLEDALGDGELNYSVIRELTRVATPANVDRWIERARGKNLRDVEQMVSGRKKGDDPDDAPDPALVEHTVHLELDAESHALWRDLRKGIEDELGRSLDDKELIAELHGRAFAVAVAPDDEVEPAAQGPRRMINISTCPDCRRAWQDGAGISMQIPATALERAQCDAIVCNNDRETPARRTIPERIRRKVMERDRWRCTFPGCRSSRNLEVHHVQHVADGGENEAINLTTLCDGHHGMHHDGVIGISGQAPDALLFSRDGRPIACVPQATLDERPHGHNAETATLAKLALQQAGFKAAIAKQAVDAALARVRPDMDLTGLIREALRNCG